MGREKKVELINDDMIVEFRDPNKRLHGRRWKGDPFYFRWHYGKQRRVYCPARPIGEQTEAQNAVRMHFTELRREVARQLAMSVVGEMWRERFAAEGDGRYKFVHTYVFAMLREAEKEGITPQEVAEMMVRQHQMAERGDAPKERKDRRVIWPIQIIFTAKKRVRRVEDRSDGGDEPNGS